jgi:hypothetical protein
MTTLREVS